MTTALAIIPARGGSKGIPHKNLAMCAGRPLVDWVLGAAKRSDMLTHFVISSDDEEILDRGRRLGISGLPRPADISRDETSTEAVMAHAIEAVGRTDLIVLLQPTSPLTEARHIDGAIRLLLMSSADSVVSVVRSHAFLWRDGKPMYGERLRRQEMDQFEENGAIYVTTRRQWEASGKRYGGKTLLHEMPDETRFQVDSPADLELVSWLLERQAVPA